MATERSSSSIAWRDGVATIAARDGNCLVLDNLDDAAPQTIERANPLFEDPPQWRLSERSDITADGEIDVPIVQE